MTVAEATTIDLSRVAPSCAAAGSTWVWPSREFVPARVELFREFLIAERSAWFARCRGELPGHADRMAQAEVGAPRSRLVQASSHSMQPAPRRCRNAHGSEDRMPIATRRTSDARTRRAEPLPTIPSAC